ncbi:MAG: serine/threonine-protein kinase, partial [Polyangiaceae bacterium]
MRWAFLPLARDIVHAHMSGDPFGVIGSVIDGQFRVDQWVGEGGFSSVYKGFHLGLQEPIAIKCLKLPQSLGRELIEQFQNRFRDESRIAYRLSQGNLHIVRSITSGTTTSPSGQVIPYMVLEWLEGLTLSQDLKKRRDAGMKGRTLEEVTQMFAPASEALAYAHAHGVVHRDIKPGNLFLAQTREGFRLKVLDFGMAKILSDGNIGIAPMAQSSTGIVVFSAPYAAPEQFDPKIGSIGTWTDVYSLALVLLEAMTDKRVRNVDSVAECLMHAVDPAQIPTPRRLGLTVSNALDEVFARALAVNPRERAQDVGEFWGQLRNAMLRDAEEQANAHDSIPPGIDGDGDDPATIVADTAGLFDNPEEQDEPTRNVDLNSPAFAQGGGLPPEVKDFLSRAQTQSARSQAVGNQTMAMQPPAAGAAWPPTPLPAAGRPIAQQPPAAGSIMQGGAFPLDSDGEPATMAMHSPLANQTYNPQQPLGGGDTAADPFSPAGALNSPQFRNAAALGMTMPLINNGPAMMAAQGMGGPQTGAPQGGYPGPAPG